MFAASRVSSMVPSAGDTEMRDTGLSPETCNFLGVQKEGNTWAWGREMGATVGVCLNSGQDSQI